MTNLPIDTDYFAQLPPIIRKKELLSILQIGKSTLYNWIQKGILPKPKKIGHLSYWAKQDIADVINRAKSK